jgi:dihydrofolate reductase
VTTNPASGANRGVAVAQECLRAGLLDEMELQLMPVLLGQGRRLFEDMPPGHIELELLDRDCGKRVNV